MNVQMYSKNPDGDDLCWEGELAELLKTNEEGLDEDEVRSLKGLKPGENVMVGMGFRVVRAEDMNDDYVPCEKCEQAVLEYPCWNCGHTGE